MSDRAPNLPHTAPNASAQAREQADAYDSLFGDTPLTLSDGTTISVPPHPDLGMLSDEAMEAYEDLQMEMEGYDREESIYIPEQRLMDENGNETGVVLPAQTTLGELKRPFRKDGVRVKPAYSVKVAQIALGEAEYQRLRAGGKSAADVWRVWSKQATELQERRKADSKSDGGSLALAAVPATDS